jgi:hypothetical protein
VHSIALQNTVNASASLPLPKFKTDKGECETSKAVERQENTVERRTLSIRYGGIVKGKNMYLVVVI